MGSKLDPILINALLALLASLLLIWLFYANPTMTQAAVGRVNSALAYPEMPAEELRTVVSAMRNWVLERQSLRERNATLETENLRLRTALHRAQAPMPQGGVDLIGARVTLRYPEAWWKEIRVDKGSSSGVRVGAPAISDGYIVGRVVRVGDDHAWIELVTSSSFMIAAVVEDTWDLGVINGDDMGNVWLLYMPPEKEFTRGMIISTALVGDYLPPGIPVGRVWGAGEPREGFTPQKVASGAHLTQLYNVQILRSGAQEDGGARH